MLSFLMFSDQGLFVCAETALAAVWRRSCTSHALFVKMKGFRVVRIVETVFMTLTLY